MSGKEEKLTLEEFHKKSAIQANNQIWPALDAENPTEKQLYEALQLAYTSRFHWGKVGTAVNDARADYMISRVYCALKMGEPALFHAERGLETVKKNKIGDFDLAFAYEVMARAYSVHGNKAECKRYRDLAQKATDEVKEEEDRKICQGELDKVTC